MSPDFVLDLVQFCEPCAIARNYKRPGLPEPISMDFGTTPPPREMIAAKVLENLAAIQMSYESPDRTPLDAGATQRATQLPTTVAEEASSARASDPRVTDYKAVTAYGAGLDRRTRDSQQMTDHRPVENSLAAPGEESEAMFVLRTLLPKLERRATEHLMRRPRPFDGSNPVSWINHTDLFMERPAVPEDDKLSVALSYPDTEALDWYVQSLNQQTRPKTWVELKQKIKRHYLAVTDEEALEELKQVRQKTAVMTYLRAFNKAASLSAALSEGLKTKLFIRGLLPEIQNWVYPQHPQDMDAAITEAVRAEGELNRQRRGRTTTRPATAPEYRRIPSENIFQKIDEVSHIAGNHRQGGTKENSDP